MKGLKEISNDLNKTVENLKKEKDIKKAVEELQQIKDNLSRIIKESTQINGCFLLWKLIV